MTQPRRDTVPMSRDEINRLRLAAALDVDPHKVTDSLIAVASKGLSENMKVDHG